MLFTFPCNPYRENPYLFQPLNSDHAYLIDPGMYTAAERQRMRDYIEEKHITLKAVLITHKHPDHICGLDEYSTLPVNPADSAYQIIATPGHKEDCVCFYFPNDGILFSGDTLFRESVGRTDLPGGDYHTLIESLQTLMALPDDTIIYPGHGPQTTISHERQFNPFI